MKNKKIKILIVTIVCILAIIAFLSVIFSIINAGNSNIISGIKIEEIDISGLSKDEAISKVEQWIENEMNKTIQLKYKEFEDNINPEEIEIQTNVTEAVLEACKIGKSGNIIKDNYDILLTMLFGKEITLQTSINEEILDKRIDEIEGKLPNVVVENSYYIDGESLIIKKGSDGVKIEKEKLKEQILQIIKKSGEKDIDIPVKNTSPEVIDIQKIHDEIYREAQNAYVSTNPTKVHAEVNGIDFAITIEEAKNIVSEEKEEYTIPLKITIPEKTISNLGEEAFPDEIATFTTMYDVSNKNRSNNLQLATEKIDGTIVMPGETFSYNKTVGERTISAGYKEAAVYVGGKVVDGIGGGICQLSSTLYNTVLYANLEIVSRTNHRFLTSYVTAGRDATVSWGTIDFQFKNTRTYPIKIVATAKNGIVEVSIYGISEDKEYEVVIESKVVETIPKTTNYIDDDTIEEGVEQIEQYGKDGAKSLTYKVVKDNGIEVSRTLLSSDTYSALETIIRRGTKKEETIPTNANIIDENQIYEDEYNILTNDIIEDY